MAGQIEVDLSHIKLTDRPLIVCDVDDVVLQFMDPFQSFLESLGHQFLPRSFRLHGNIVSAADGSALEEAHVQNLISEFFAAQESWQKPFELVVQMLNGYGRDADVLFLTAMPPLFAQQRRRLLDRTGLLFPMLATEEPKGPVVHALHAGRDLPVVFIDDMARNLHSVKEHVPDCLLIHLMPDSPVHRFAPQASEEIARAKNWGQAAELIDAHLAAGSVRRADPAA